jgi:hypothetical protein
MSYSGLLKHTCHLLELRSGFKDGIPTSQWVQVTTKPHKCFLDLQFIRRGKDPLWTPEAGRVSDRTGVLFVDKGVTVKSGMRVKMVFGPSGTFLVEGAVDEVWRPTELHHYECGVTEVPSQVSAGTGSK